MATLFKQFAQVFLIALVAIMMILNAMMILKNLNNYTANATNTTSTANANNTTSTSNATTTSHNERIIQTHAHALRTIDIGSARVKSTSKPIQIDPAYATDNEWVFYNPSILQLPSDIWSDLCPSLMANEMCHQTPKAPLFLITMFVKVPNAPYGSTIWMGVVSYERLRPFLDTNSTKQRLTETDWILPPTFVQNVLGPKAADPRILLLPGNKLGFVAYTAWKEESAIEGMRDYHVRVASIAARSKRSSCQQETCPPQPPKSNSGEFYADCDYAHLHCQDDLYGVKVYLNSLRHFPQKNLQPIIQHESKTNHHDSPLLHLIDFTPPREIHPLVYAVSPKTGALLARTPMKLEHESCGELRTNKWRGSTQVIPVKGSEDLYITILHLKVLRKNYFEYKNRVLVLGISQQQEDDPTSMTVSCRFFSDQDMLEPREKDENRRRYYNFAVGLTHSTKNDRYFVSYGESNLKAFLQEIEVTLNSKDLINKTEESHIPSSAFQGINKIHPLAMQFFTMYVFKRGHVPSRSQMDQFIKNFQSIHFHHPGAPIHFFTTDSLPPYLREEIQKRAPFVNFVVFDLLELIRGTPADTPNSASYLNNCGWKELSDLVRLAMLWRWGGTWIDTDDVVVRPVAASFRNVLPYLEWPGLTRKVYWGSDFTLIHGKWKPGGPRDAVSGFHVQNDPLVSWEPGNPFLARWMRALVTKYYECKDWGQLLPTNIFLSDTMWASQHVTFVPQSTLLLHPAFGNAKKKGTMFPLYDYRLPEDFPHYDTSITHAEFQTYFKQMVKVQPFFAVKAKTEHYKKGKNALETRWIPGWVAVLDVEEIHALVEEATAY